MIPPVPRLLRCRSAALLSALVCLAAPGAAFAGPPYQTDDPEPTGTGHWENYVALDIAGTTREWGGEAGLELNYGAAKDLQLSLGVPLALSHASGTTVVAFGDLAPSIKYRFYNDEKAGFSVAAFPALTLPTAGRGLGAGRVTATIPVWAQKVSGDWTVFGGGGFSINPGPGNRNYWSAGLAASRKLSDKLELGGEVFWQGPDADGANAQLTPGLGAIWHLTDHVSLVASGGPVIPLHGTVREGRLFAAVRLDE